MIEPTIESYVFQDSLKNIKKSLGSKCLFLANRIVTSSGSDSSRYIDVHLSIDGNKEKFAFEFPMDLTVVKQADYSYLQELISEKLK